MKRLFAAIKVQPSEIFLTRYWALRDSLKEEKIRWVDLDNIHLTLKFFGETPEHHIPAISLALNAATSGITPFDLGLENTGIFGSSYKPRVIWFGVGPCEELRALSNNIMRELEKIGIEDDRQNFVPHITVGRMKFLNDKKRFQQAVDKHREGHIQKKEVKNFHLFESILRPQGPVYSILESYALMDVDG